MESVGSDDEPEVIEVPDEQDPNQEDPVFEEHFGRGGKYDQFVNKQKREREAEMHDLADFFGNVPREKQISICRAYGSYLAALERAAQPVAKRTYFKSGLFKKRA